MSPDTGDHKTQLVLEMQSGRPEQGLAGGRRQRVSLHTHEQPTPGEQAASVTVGQQRAPQHPSGLEQQLTPTSDRLQHQVAPHGGRHLVE